MIQASKSEPTPPTQVPATGLKAKASQSSKASPPVETASPKPQNWVQLEPEETDALMAWAIAQTEPDKTMFETGQRLAQRLGAHPRPDGLTELGFWVPELTGQIMPAERNIYIEVFTPLETVDFSQAQQVIPFRYECVEVPVQGEFAWAVVSGMTVGNREAMGSLYWLRYRDLNDGQLYTVRDIAPYSLPYGIFAPAELYDMAQLQRDRGDLTYLEASAAATPVTPAATGNEPALPRVPAPTNILQLHIPTASEEGSLAGLTRIYGAIAEKVRNDEPLTPAEQTYIGYDAIQLLPTEPTIEYRSEDGARNFFSFDEGEDTVYGTLGPVCTQEALSITLQRPNTQNWGYDVPILGSSTTNPALLGSLRPDEVIDFIATLHNFPGQPIQIIYDLVYGHSDNQALELINRQFVAGPNMYGQDLSHTMPMVRAILLEMQRRKANDGIDGIRIDGGQDFRFFNPLSGRLEYDDNYLMAMSDVVQDIEGHQRLLFTIFEDGRPWPEEGWEFKSTYRELVELRPDSFQWGPLIFAHNTPALKGFWDYKWNRVLEVMQQGDRWITGCGNHDTIRRGTQIETDPVEDGKEINWNLGETLPEVLDNAYDNPGTSLWVYGFSPGLPMDFLNGMMHSGWGFFRNTDELYGVKVASEEIGFLHWQVTQELYEQPQFFTNIKQSGFKRLSQLRRFATVLADTMEKYEYDLDQVASSCREWGMSGRGLAQEVPALVTFFQTLEAIQLKAFARHLMEDSHEFSRVSHFTEDVDSDRAAFNLSLRQYRRQNPWLMNNLDGTDRFNRINEFGYTLFYGLRTQPSPADSSPLESAQYKQIAMLSHMGGTPAQTALLDWLQLTPSEWRIVLQTPGLGVESMADLQGLLLKDSQALLLERTMEA